MELRVVTATTDFGLANVLKGVLEAADIEVALSGTGLENVYPGTGLATIQVLVRPEDYARASNLVEQTGNQGTSGDENESA